MNITRYVSVQRPEEELDLEAIRKELLETEAEHQVKLREFNGMLQELGLEAIV